MKKSVKFALGTLGVVATATAMMHYYKKQKGKEKNTKDEDDFLKKSFNDSYYDELELLDEDIENEFKSEESAFSVTKNDLIYHIYYYIDKERNIVKYILLNDNKVFLTYEFKIKDTEDVKESIINSINKVLMLKLEKANIKKQTNSLTFYVARMNTKYTKEFLENKLIENAKDLGLLLNDKQSFINKIGIVNYQIHYNAIENIYALNKFFQEYNIKIK